MVELRRQACPVPQAPHTVEPPRVSVLNDHLNALVALSQVLESMAREEATAIAERARHVLTGPQSQIDAAIDRLGGFLTSLKNRI
jgi:hypothetical protein